MCLFVQAIIYSFTIKTSFALILLSSKSLTKFILQNINPSSQGFAVVQSQINKNDSSKRYLSLHCSIIFNERDENVGNFRSWISVNRQVIKMDALSKCFATLETGKSSRCGRTE